MPFLFYYLTAFVCYLGEFDDDREELVAAAKLACNTSCMSPSEFCAILMLYQVGLVNVTYFCR